MLAIAFRISLIPCRVSSTAFAIAATLTAKLSTFASMLAIRPSPLSLPIVSDVHDARRLALIGTAPFGSRAAGTIPTSECRGAVDGLFVIAPVCGGALPLLPILASLLLAASAICCSRSSATFAIAVLREMNRSVTDRRSAPDIEYPLEVCLLNEACANGDEIFNTEVGEPFVCELDVAKWLAAAREIQAAREMC